MLLSVAMNEGLQSVSQPALCRVHPAACDVVARLVSQGCGEQGTYGYGIQKGQMLVQSCGHIHAAVACLGSALLQHGQLFTAATAVGSATSWTE